MDDIEFDFLKICTKRPIQPNERKVVEDILGPLQKGIDQVWIDESGIKIFYHSAGKFPFFRIGEKFTQAMRKLNP